MVRHDASVDTQLGDLGFLLRHDRSTGLAYAVAFSVVVHAAVFTANWPSPAEPVRAPAGELIRVPIHRFISLPKPRPAEMVRPPARRVPVPDPTPLGPEEYTEPPTPEAEVPDIPPFPFPEVIPPDPPVEDVRPADAGPIRIGGPIAPPRQIHRVNPRYTEAARQARIQGAVILDTVIDTEGRIQEVTVLEELPLGLTESAVEAVRQWRFEPSTLNGRAVAVRYELTVRFRLE